MNKKCIYCGRKNIIIGNCGVCKICCRSFITVCEDNQCEVGKEVKEEIIEEFEKYIRK